LHGYRASFWTLPTLFLSDVGAAAGIGVINCFGNLGGFLGPYMVGFLSNNTGSYRSGMLFLGACALLASTFVLLVRTVPAGGVTAPSAIGSGAAIPSQAGRG